MKKLNSVLSVITSAMFITHAVSMALIMLKVIPFLPWVRPLGGMFAGLFSLHAFISILILFLNINNGKTLKFFGINWLTYAQRIAAVLIIILIHRHFGAYTTFSAEGKLLFSPKTISLMITELLLIITTCMHFFIALPRAFLSLGIVKDDKSLLTWQITAMIIAGVVLLLSIAGNIAYFIVRV